MHSQTQDREKTLSRAEDTCPQSTRCPGKPDGSHVCLWGGRRGSSGGATPKSQEPTSKCSVFLSTENEAEIQLLVSIKPGEISSWTRALPVPWLPTAAACQHKCTWLSDAHLQFKVLIWTDEDLSKDQSTPGQEGPLAFK